MGHVDARQTESMAPIRRHTEDGPSARLAAVACMVGSARGSARRIRSRRLSRKGKRGDQKPLHSDDGPLELPPVALPIDPYVLGVWLGDGSSKAGEITCHVDDFAHYRDQFAERGESLALPTASRAKGNTWTCAVSPAYRACAARLR